LNGRTQHIATTEPCTTLSQPFSIHCFQAQSRMTTAWWHPRVSDTAAEPHRPPTNSTVCAGRKWLMKKRLSTHSIVFQIVHTKELKIIAGNLFCTMKPRWRFIRIRRKLLHGASQLITAQGTGLQRNVTCVIVVSVLSYNLLIYLMTLLPEIMDRLRWNNTVNNTKQTSLLFWSRSAIHMHEVGPVLGYQQSLEIRCVTSWMTAKLLYFWTRDQQSTLTWSNCRP
jgi:hypothetical protein